MSRNTLKWLIFGLVSFFTWLVYFITTAPTIVFWDVGEFLACSVSFSVPHPPGTPLYVVLGRFMTLLPLPLAPIYRLLTGSVPVNTVLKITMISMTSGALTAGFVYLIVYEVIKEWKTDFPDVFAHLAGIFGGLIGAFARTVWMNSIEAETYTPSVFVVAFLVWVTLKWYKNRDKKDSIRYILFTIYVLFLSSGIHLMPLVYFPVLFVFVAVMEPKLVWDLEFLGTAGLAGILLSVIEILYEPSLKWYVLFGISVVMLYYYFEKRKLFYQGEIVIWVGILGLLVGVFGMLIKHPHITWVGSLVFLIGAYWGTQLYKDWKGLALILILVAVSVELVLILRAINNPPINEADPSNFKAFMDVLTRKQYGPGGIFPRNIPWGDQFKVYWLYWSWQYKELLIPITLLAVFGMFTHFENDRKTFLLVFGTFLIFSLGLLVYLNLKDSPTHPVNPFNPTEVRDRDYFYAGAYTFTGLYAGIGLWEVLRLLWVNLKKRATKLIAIIGYALAGLMVGVQIASFYPIVNRNHNYVAEDYAHDLLVSVKGRGVLFTNGDNDTFPLWAAQLVLGDRTDVINANLSYLNTGWYCVQLKQKGAPISFPDSVLLRMPPAIWDEKKNKPIFMRDVIIKDMIATSMGYKYKGEYAYFGDVKVPAIYLDDEAFVKEVFDGKRKLSFPLYFATSCSPEVYRPYSKYLQLEGLAFRLMDRPVKGIFGATGYSSVNLERTDYLLHADVPVDTFFTKYKYKIYSPEIFRYRGMVDSMVFKDGAHLLVLKNIAAVALQMANYAQFMMKQDSTKRDFYIQKTINGLKVARIMAVNILPFEKNKIQMVNAIDLYLAEFYRQIGEYKNAMRYLDESYKYTPAGGEGRYYTLKGMLFYQMGQMDSAKLYLESALLTKLGASYKENYLYLAKIYLQKGDTAKAEKYLERINVKLEQFDSVFNEIQKTF